jgi:excisionase family DNA binding protein
MTKLMVDLREAEALTGVSQSSLRRLLKRGEIRATRVGRRLLVTISELKKLARPGASSATGRTTQGPEGGK